MGVIKSLVREVVSHIDPAWLEAGPTTSSRTWKPSCPHGVLRPLPGIYLDEPDGESGFWARLSAMQTPALYIFGRHDTLIPCGFGKKVEESLPRAPGGGMGGLRPRPPKLEHPSARRGSRDRLLRRDRPQASPPLPDQPGQVLGGRRGLSGSVDDGDPHPPTIGGLDHVHLSLMRSVRGCSDVTFSMVNSTPQTRRLRCRRHPGRGGIATRP